MSHTEFLTGTTVEATNTTKQEPSTLSEKLQESPQIQKVLDATSQAYNDAKNYNNATRWSFGKIENAASQAPLKRIDQYAGNVVDKAGELYSKAEIDRRTNDALTSAEKAVDSYLPDTRQRNNSTPTKAEIVEITPAPTQSASQRERAVNLGKTVLDRVKERVYRLYLLIASYALFIFAETILLTVDAARESILFGLTTGFKFIRVPRETVLELIERVQQAILYGVYLLLHPVELLQLVVARAKRSQRRIAENNDRIKQKSQ